MSETHPEGEFVNSLLREFASPVSPFFIDLVRDLTLEDVDRPERQHTASFYGFWKFSLERNSNSDDVGASILRHFRNQVRLGYQRIAENSSGVSTSAVVEDPWVVDNLLIEKRDKGVVVLEFTCPCKRGFVLIFVNNKDVYVRQREEGEQELPSVADRDADLLGVLESLQKSLEDRLSDHHHNALSKAPAVSVYRWSDNLALLKLICECELDYCFGCFGGYLFYNLGVQVD